MNLIYRGRARGLDPKNLHHLDQVFRSRPSPRQRGVIKECNLARRSLDGLRRSLGRAWIEIQDQIRTVLNAVWDPIGVADAVDDEYDSYIEGIYSLLQSGASEDMIAKHLVSIEVEQMGFSGSPLNKLLTVAATLRMLQLPALP